MSAVVVPMSLLRQHLNLHPDDTSQDELLESYLEAAVEFAAGYCNRTIPWHAPNGDQVSVPKSIRQAILLLVGDFYENREGQITGMSRSDNPAVERLLHPWRIGLGV